MVENFNTNKSMVNLSLSLYFLVYAVGLLFWGPLSEKFGRKIILIMGISIYTLTSLLCAYADSIEFLISSRILQAFGGSAVTVVATAIVKDLYEGREREKIMATIMSWVIIAPMGAPVLGALLLKFASWRMIFVFLTGFGLIAAMMAICYRETLKNKYSGSVFRSWGRLTIVIKNKTFVELLIIFSIVPTALMAYLAAASYIYIDTFNLTEQEFSYIFGFNALAASVGPSLYMKLSKHISIHRIITLCFTALTVCGCLTYSLGHLSPWVFALLIAPVTLAIIITRVPGTHLMLEQNDKDTGSAVAIIHFASMLFGGIGMMLVSIRPESLIENLGIIQILVGITAGLLWLKKDLTKIKFN
jgi:DHA1 family bicyclomycin/chloramphenicol resistance-like MFS transporter